MYTLKIKDLIHTLRKLIYCSFDQYSSILQKNKPEKNVVAFETYKNLQNQSWIRGVTKVLPMSQL